MTDYGTEHTSRWPHRTITEPFAPNYDGEVLPIDHAMRRELKEWADSIQEAQQISKALGDIATNYDSTVT